MIDVHLGRLGAALGLAVLLAQPAHAFSQIGAKNGPATQREGIVSVPLPPLAGTAAPAAQPAESPAAGQTAPVEGQPSTTPAAPPTTGTPAPPAGASPQTPPAPTPDAPQTSPDEEPDADPSDPDAAPLGEDPEVPQTDGEVRPDPGTVPPGAVAKSTDEEDAGPAPAIVYGDEGLPKPVRDLREKLMEIAKAGDIEALRPYIQVGDNATLLSFGESEDDPIKFLKTASGDGEGVEVLAILLEVLEAGHVRNEPNSDNEIFVWPYFTAMAVDKLTKPQKVELFELVTAGDYQEMLGFGAYNFYRLGISPDGKLQFFVAGD